MNMLFVGFSVTAAKPGYYYELVDLSNRGVLDFTVDFLALGGLHSHQLAHLFPLLMAQKKADVIVFELLTSGARKLGDRNPQVFYEEPLRSMIEFLYLSNTKIVLLNLFRKDVDYSSDKMLNTFLKIAIEYEIDVINVYKDLIKENYNIDDYIWDVVHTTKKGAKYYCDKILQYIKNESFSIRPTFGEIVNTKDGVKFDSTPLIVKEDNCFMGKGFYLPWQSLTVSRNLRFEFDEPIDSEMICFITGPTAAEIAVEINNTETVLMRPYDRHSYYERVYVIPFRHCHIKTLDFNLVGTVPDLGLVKSSWDESCRQVKLVSIFTKNRLFNV